MAYARVRPVQRGLRCSPRTQRTVPLLARMTTLSVVIVPPLRRLTPLSSEPSVTPVAAKMQSPLASSVRSYWRLRSVIPQRRARGRPRRRRAALRRRPVQGPPAVPQRRRTQPRAALGDHRPQQAIRSDRAGQGRLHLRRNGGHRRLAAQGRQAPQGRNDDHRKRGHAREQRHRALGSGRAPQAALNHAGRSWTTWTSVLSEKTPLRDRSRGIVRNGSWSA